MAYRVTFIPNRRGLEEVGRSREVQAAVKKRADAIAAEAQRLARAEAYDTGAYHDSITVEEDTSEDVALARVSASVPYAAIVEFGSVDTPRFRILGRAADTKE